MQALRLLKRTTSEGKLYYIQKAVNNIQEGLNWKRAAKRRRSPLTKRLHKGFWMRKQTQMQTRRWTRYTTTLPHRYRRPFGDRLNAWRYFCDAGQPAHAHRNVVGNIVYQIPTHASNKVSATLKKAL